MYYAMRKTRFDSYVSFIVHIAIHLLVWLGPLCSPSAPMW